MKKVYYKKYSSKSTELSNNVVEKNSISDNSLVDLFQIPNIIVKIPTIWLLQNSMINYEILYNAHLIVRYITIEAFYSNDEKWWKIYNRMQKLRVRQQKIIPREKANNELAFKNLIKSFENNGFNSNYPIIINKNFRLIDGSHRLALALYFKIPYVYVKIEPKTINMDPEYSIKWFEQNGFTDIVDNIRSTYIKIFNEWGN